MLLFLAVALVSAGALAYEVLLTRLFSIVQWHHYAYMVISIALLGYGASGAFLALVGDGLRRHLGAAFAAGAALFAVSAVTSFAVAERLPFNALAVIWEPRQLLFLPILYTLFALPFFGAATCIGLALAAFPERVGRIYRYDLIGAAAGAIGLMLALFVLFPDTALRLVALLGLLAAALGISLRESGAIRKGRAAACSAAAIAACAALPPSWTALHLSEYKGLSQALLVPGAKVLAEDSSPLGLLTVVSSPTIPLRHAPGLSLYNATEPPAQLGVFTDGDGLTAITAFDGRREPLNYLDSTPTALPYHLLEKPEVLILGAGGGTDILLALLHGATTIDAVEINPQLVRLVAERFAAFAGHLYERPGVRVHVAEARSFVAGRRDRYDVIQIPLLDSFAAAAAGTHSLSESYVYTIEALEQYRSFAAGRLSRNHALAEAAAARQSAAVRHRGFRTRAPRDRRAGPTPRARAELEHHHAPGQERPADWPGHGKNPTFRRRARLRPRLPPRHGARGSEPIQYSRSALFLRWCGSVTRARARSIPS